MKHIGLCITGSFCSMNDLLYILERLKEHYELEIFMTPHVYTMDTRFNKADELKNKIKAIIDQKIHTTIQEAEVYGPFKSLDAVVVYPCDSNTLTKLSMGINDNCVTMLVKSTLRNNKPIILGIYTNDLLSNSGYHFMNVLNKKNYYITPMYQDDYKNKPNSMIAKKELLLDTLNHAFNHQQIQPLMLGYKEV